MREHRHGYVLLAAYLMLVGGCRDRGRTDDAPPKERLPVGTVSEDSERAITDAAREISDTAYESESGDSMNSAIEEAIPRSGIEGRVTIGPQCPVLEEGVPCPDRPYQAELRVLEESSGRVVVTFTSGADGRFRVDLPPGRYVLDPGEPLLVDEPRAEKMTINVEAGSYTEVTVRFDSGVR
jgi:hypothetical protein